MRPAVPLFLALVGCSPDRVAPPLNLPGGLATDGGTQVWWTDPGTAPGEESETELDDALVDLIDASTTSVDLALYEFDLPEVVAAVEDAWDRGVDVRMVGDGDEVHDAGYLALEAAGIPIVSRRAGDRIMHHKFAVVDGQAVWTGSTNLSHNGIYRNDNHAIIVHSTDMADSYTHELEQMFGGEFGRGKTATSDRSLSLADGQLSWHFSPTHDPIDVVVDAIDNADHQVAFMVFSFTHADVADALQRAVARGVEVVGIFDESQANGAWSVDEALAAAGVPVLIDGNGNSSGFSGGKLHHKVLIVDPGTPAAAVVSGSMNWSNAGTSDNDENLVLIESPSLAEPMMEHFCTLMEVATVHPDFAGEVPELCGEAEPVSPYLGVAFINEVRGAQGRSSGQGRFVELVSASDSPVVLDGWRLERGDGRLVHAFEAATVEPDSAVVLVGAHWRGSTGDFVVSEVPLDIDLWGSLSLVAPDGAVVDTFSLLNSSPNSSLNRSLDGVSDAVPARHATLTADGASASPGVRLDGRAWAAGASPDVFVINELLPDPDGADAGEEFVELVNAGTLPLDPTGFTLCDESGICHTFGPPMLLPGEAIVLFDDGEHSDVPGARLSESGRLSLNNSGDTLTDARGEVHDTVGWSTSSAGVSWNRTTDGDPEALLSRHNRIDGAAGEQSPGTQLDGVPWRTP